MIRQSSIDELKSRIDIVDVVGSYLELKKAGVNYKARCPFHDEKSASFVVSPAKQIYHCFGCGAGGDAIGFVKEMEKLSYPESIEKLAREFNVRLEYDAGQKREDENKTLAQLGDFFTKRLLSHPEAESYLKERGIFHSSIEKFEIGYAPSSAEQLRFFETNFIKADEALETGVLGQDESGRYYARFIERITFPIYSGNGIMVGFGGRTITNHPAKYVNSPQTRFFNKSRLLYAYHLAKESIYRKKELIVTEGYLDVIMLHQAGFTNVVATLGTALTAEHLPLLKKGEPRVIVAYDGDNAGKAAALKAARMLAQSNFEGGVVLFGEGKDPADLVKEGKQEYLNTLFKHPKNFTQFVIETVAAEFDINVPEQRKKAAQEIDQFIRVLDPLVREEYENFASITLKSSKNIFKSEKKLPGSGTKREASDTAEMSILKGLLLFPKMVDYILDIGDEGIFEFHRDIFVAIMREEFDNKMIVEMNLNETIKPCTEEELLSGINRLLIKNLEKQLEFIKIDPAIHSDHRMSKIRTLQNRLHALKRGAKTAW
jgi:DNA primase